MDRLVFIKSLFLSFFGFSFFEKNKEYINCYFKIHESGRIQFIYDRGEIFSSYMTMGSRANQSYFLHDDVNQLNNFIKKFNIPDEEYKRVDTFLTDSGITVTLTKDSDNNFSCQSKKGKYCIVEKRLTYI